MNLPLVKRARTDLTFQGLPLPHCTFVVKCGAEDPEMDIYSSVGLAMMFLFPKIDKLFVNKFVLKYKNIMLTKATTLSIALLNLSHKFFILS